MLATSLNVAYVVMVLLLQTWNMCVLSLFLPLPPCVCEWNFTWSDQLLQNQKVNNGTTMYAIKCTICFIVTIVYMKISLHFVFANRYFSLNSGTNNDNWHLQWHQCDATADINTSQYIYKFWAKWTRLWTAAERFCGLHKCSIFLLSAKRVCKRYFQSILQSDAWTL